MYWGYLLFSYVLGQCPTNTTDSSCASFRLPDANASLLLSDLCVQMPGMPGCSLNLTCSNDPWCNPFSLYAAACIDMPGMTSCATYNNMCGSNHRTSLVSQCNQATIANLPSSSKVTQNIYGICSSMSMPGCEKCSIKSSSSTYASCDLLGVYSSLCASMPEMSQCSDWSSMCSSTPSLSFCTTGNAELPPPMQMFFHSGISDYILFQRWVPRTNGQYAGAVMACFIAAFLYEALQTWLAIFEIKWAHESKKRSHTLSCIDELTEDAFKTSSSVFYDAKSPLSLLFGYNNGITGFQIALTRGFFKLIMVTVGYLLMLISMTFNIGLFLAIVCGFAVGTVCFAPVAKHWQLKYNFNAQQETQICH